MEKKYVVELTDGERQMLRELISSGKGSARKIAHTRVLLKADSSDGKQAMSDSGIAKAVEVGTATAARVRQRFVEEGLEAALVRRMPRREYRRKLDGDAEAHLIALACSEPPEGRSRWIELPQLFTNLYKQ